MRLFSHRQPPRRGVAFFGAFVVMLVVGMLDCVAGYEVSLFVFYAIPILVGVWFCGPKSALLLAVLCGFTWSAADLIAGHSYSKNWLAVWEPIVRFAFFIFVAVAGAKLKQHQDAVRSRIALLEHSQRLEREIVEISEGERRRIGQDLHDGICQFLAGIGCAAAALQANLSRKHMATDAAAAAEVAELLEDSIVQTRDLARGLVPVQMDEAGLPSALKELTASVGRLHGIDCDFEADALPPTCTTTAATHLYRIAQEAIANAIRHGGARRIRVRLAIAPDGGQLQINDNGTGIPVKIEEETQGMGIKIMMYRARMIAGDLTIGRSSDGGTTVTCLFNPNNVAQAHGQVL